MLTRKIPAIRQKTLLYTGLLMLAFTLIVTACGTNGGPGTGGNGNNPGSTPTSTVSKGYGASQGCPTDAVATSDSTKASVVVRPPQATGTVVAHTGDTIEFLLPFGMRWRGPTASQGTLKIEEPYGYALKSENSCVWHFTASGTGKVEVQFSGSAICKAGTFCPMYVMLVPFTIEVK